MMLPEVTTLTPLAGERVNAGGTTLITTSTPTRRDALLATLRFVRIPLVCAALVALTSPATAGRVVALAIGVAIVGVALVLNGRALFGRPAGR